MTTILVGVDGTRRADAAAKFAALLAERTRARLIVASVYSFRTLSGRMASGERAQALVEEVVRRAVGIPCETRIALALSPAEGLRQLADDERADLVVLGSRHRGRLGEALAGGVGRRLVRGATFPVALVPDRADSPALDRIGVYAGRGAGGARARAAATRWADAARVELQDYDGGAGPSVSDELAAGRLDVLVVPGWPHGLAGRLRRHASRARTAGCVLLVVPQAGRGTTVEPATTVS
jgi:nucleotide-binding universal stress UspA family protein